MKSKRSARERKSAALSSRKKHGHAQVLLDETLRNHLRYIAFVKRKKFVVLLNEIARKEIRAWERATGEDIEKIFASGNPLNVDSER